MERRNFIIVSALGATAVGLPIWYFKSQNDIDPISEPGALSYIWDDETILEVGKQYLQKFPGESTKSILKEKLIGSETHSLEDNVQNIQQKIDQEFTSDNMVIIDGWVLSVTEARQCALFYLNK